jgi:hypothetical protein
MPTETAQHTPGPWRHEQGAFGLYISALWQDDVRKRIRVADMPAEEMDPETEANARLIAAAPELLEALRRFANAMEQRSYPELQGVASDAFAAIAKAEGR